jgi:hypothetical protein
VIGKWDALLGAAGLALFAFAASRIGWSAVIHAVAEARTGVVIVIVLSFLRLSLQTRSWLIALRADGIELPFGELMLIRMASTGMGYLSVLGAAASEPMKIGLLRRSGDSGAAATLVDSGVYWFTSGMVGIAGCLSAGLLLAHSRHSIASLAVCGSILAAGLFLIARPKPRLSLLANALGARCPRWLQKGKRLEAALREFADRHPGPIRRMFLLDVACQVLLAAEVVAILWSLKIPFHAGIVLGIEGVTRAIKIMAGWMPARIGADESGIAGAFLAFGLSPASGLTLALARRSRDLLGAAIGLSWLALSAGFWKVKKEKNTCAR